MVREGKKQISMYIPENTHAEIKDAAIQRDKSITEYLISLHKSEFSSGKTLDIYDMVSKLYAKQIKEDEYTPTMTGKPSIASPPASSEPKPKSQEMPGAEPIPLTTQDLERVSNIPNRVREFIQTITNPSQREKSIRVILCIHEARKMTRNEIKKQLQLKGKSAPKQLDRMVNIGVIIKDTDQIPHLFRINQNY